MSMHQTDADYGQAVVVSARKRPLLLTITPEVGHGGQTAIIRLGLRAGYSNIEIVEALDSLNKIKAVSTTWGQARMDLYESAYGPRGISDPKL